MEETAPDEVEVFKEQCKIGGSDTGSEILEELLKQKKLQKAAKRRCTAASPKKVAMWIRKEECHPGDLDMVKREYQFAPELRARLAAEIFQTP